VHENEALNLSYLYNSFWLSLEVSNNEWIPCCGHLAIYLTVYISRLAILSSISDAEMGLIPLQPAVFYRVHMKNALGFKPINGCDEEMDSTPRHRPWQAALAASQ
jgi:hypothetical protein